MVGRYKYILLLIVTILVGIGSVWLLIDANQLTAGSAHAVSMATNSITPSPSPKFQQSTPLPLPTPTERIIIGPFVSQQAPSFSLKTRDGDLVTLENIRGKVVLLNFWASWCIPCKEEMPIIQAAYEKYRDHGLVVLGINMTDLDNRKAIGKFIQETGVTFPILLDESGSASSDYRVISIPTSFFIDHTGIIRHFQIGAMSAEQLQQYLDEMLK